MILSQKLKNALVSASSDGELKFTLRNIVVNGAKRGCSGFIRNPKNGSVVYVTTERCIYGGVKNFMYRYADSEKDFTGYRNRWCDTLEELVANICAMLRETPQGAHEYRH